MRRTKHLPRTKVQTDSYVSVQLIEQQKALDFDSLRYMAEQVEGSFTFTVLDEQNALWIVKGDNPLSIAHFPELGVYVYASTHDDGPGTGFSIGDDEFEVYSGFAPLLTEKRFVKTVCSAFKKESGLLEYLTEKGEKDVMVCGIMTDFCINATVEAGFEHGLHMIVPAYANSTKDNEYMTGEQSYHYYNEFLWPDCYADCVPMEKALELLKK